MKKISIIIPVYCNRDSLELLMERLIAIGRSLDEMLLCMELIFVDDGSNDNSFNVLKQIKRSNNNVTVVKLTRNFGAVHAAKCGLEYSTGDCFTFLAADLQDPPEMIIKMVERWLSGAKLTICVRESREDPFISKLFSYLFYKLLNLMVVKGYPVGGFDMALMDSSLKQYLTQSSKNTYIPVLLFWLGFKPEILYYHREARKFGKSKWTFSKKVKASIDVLLTFSVVPIRLISMLGFFIALLSFVYGSMVVINAILGNIPVQGFAALASIMSFLFGLTIFMLGMVGEYLWRSYDQLSLRPESVVDEVL